MQDYYGDKNKWFVGVVEDVGDSNNRVRVRIAGIHPEAGRNIQSSSTTPGSGGGGSTGSGSGSTTPSSGGGAATGPGLIQVDEASLPAPNQMSGKISKHFTLGDLTSSQFGRKGRQLGKLTPEIVKNLANLSRNCLDPLKEQFGNMVITSGWRLGAADGGVGSQRNHPGGFAADIQVPGMSPQAVANWVQQNLKGRFTALEIATRHTHVQLGGDPNGTTSSPHIFSGSSA